MQAKKVLAIDVDETIVSLKEDWLLHAKKNHGIDLTFKKEITDIRVLDFWDQEDLYDDKEPMDSVIDIINNLHKHYSIFFVSHCTDAHFRSKLNFIMRYFKFDGFINTPEKYRIQCDYIIDDRDIFFEPFKEKNKETKCILLKTEYIGSGFADYHLDWKEIEKLLLSEITL